MKTNEYPYIGYTIVTREEQGGWAGVAKKKGVMTIPRILDASEKQVIEAIRNRLGTLHPKFIGYSGAATKFIAQYGGGLGDPEYRRRERDQKAAASALLGATLPVAAAIQATPAQAAAIADLPIWTDLLHYALNERLKEALRGPNGADFARASATLALPSAGVLDRQTALDAIQRAVAPHGDAYWSLVTYLPFLWDPARVVFMTKTSLVGFAERVGDQFQDEYQPERKVRVLDDALAFMERVALQMPIADAKLVNPDMIDVQAFVWVAAKY